MLCESLKSWYFQLKMSVSRERNLNFIIYLFFLFSICGTVLFFSQGYFPKNISLSGEKKVILVVCSQSNFFDEYLGKRNKCSTEICPTGFHCHRCSQVWFCLFLANNGIHSSLTQTGNLMTLNFNYNSIIIIRVWLWVTMPMLIRRRLPYPE